MPKHGGGARLVARQERGVFFCYGRRKAVRLMWKGRKGNPEIPHQILLPARFM